MVNYAQYLTAAQNPADALMRGYGQGLQAQAQEQEINMRDQALMQQQAALSQAQQERDNVSKFFRTQGRRSLDDFTQLAIDNPSLQKQIMNSFKVRNQTEQDDLMRGGLQVFSALRNDRPEIALQQVEERATAFEEAGRDKDAAEYRQIADYIKQDPKLAEDYVGQALSFINPDFAKTVRGSPTTGQERIIQQLQEEAAAKGEELSTQDALMRLRGFTPERIAFEEKRASAVQSAKGESDLTYKPKIEQRVQEVKTGSKQLQGLDTQINTVTGELAEFESKFPSLVQNLQGAKGLVEQLPFGVAEEAAQSLAKASGIETESMVAQSKFDSILKNQILPLLKQTFGAQFTEKEGEKLQQTIEGDGGPRSKMETIETFISQKVKDIEAKSLELSKLRGERDKLSSGGDSSNKETKKRFRFNPQTGDIE